MRRFHSSLGGRDLAFFESVLGSKHVLQRDLYKYNTDWTQQFHGRSDLVLQPESTSQVSAVLEYCNRTGIKVVPQGGNTGLVGGGVPLGNEVVLSLSRMNKILGFDEQDGTITLEAGVVLEDAERYCADRGWTMPLDLGSKGSCQIGGNLSTNAGGIRFLRFGSLRSNCLGLTAVLANGEVVDSMRMLKKDNVGYDLKHLFIGSEGTLGVITRAGIQVHAKPDSSRVVVFGVQTFSECVELMRLAKQLLGQSLSAFEYFDRRCLFERKSPLSPSAADVEFYVLLECIAFSPQEDDAVMDKLSRLMERAGGGNTPAVMSQSPAQFQQLWELREAITPRLRQTPTTHVFKYDVSIPPALFDQATQTVAEIVSAKHPKLKVYQYGHLGDGNLHFNATIDLNESGEKDPAKIQLDVEHELYKFVQQHHGSISAEHGLGQLKASKILKSRSPSEVKWMQAIKHQFDPNGTLNPGKVLPTGHIH